MNCVCNHEMTRHDWKNQWVCHRCGRTKPIHQFQTNADRIRAMSDEELANNLIQFTELDCRIGFCKNRPECDVLLDTEEGVPEEKCVCCLLEWLQQLAEDQ